MKAVINLRNLRWPLLAVLFLSFFSSVSFGGIFGGRQSDINGYEKMTITNNTPWNFYIMYHTNKGAAGDSLMLKKSTKVIRGDPTGSDSSYTGGSAIFKSWSERGGANRRFGALGSRIWFSANVPWGSSKFNRSTDFALIYTFNGESSAGKTFLQKDTKNEGFPEGGELTLDVVKEDKTVKITLSYRDPRSENDSGSNTGDRYDEDSGGRPSPLPSDPSPEAPSNPWAGDVW